MSNPGDEARVIWRPHDAQRSPMGRFAAAAAARWERHLDGWPALHAWSVDHRDEFWRSVWEVCAIVGVPGDTVIADADALPGARFFPQARLNFAENL